MKTQNPILLNHFHRAMIGIYIAARSAGYDGRSLRSSIYQIGGYATAKHVLLPMSNGRIHEGFANLHLIGRLDLSVENLVAQERWRALFTAREIAEAHTRLETYRVH